MFFFHHLIHNVGMIHLVLLRPYNKGIVWWYHKFKRALAKFVVDVSLVWTIYSFSHFSINSFLVN